MPAHVRAAAGGASAGAGPGSGPLPGLLLFKSGLTGMGYAKHTRFAIRIRGGPVRIRFEFRLGIPVMPELCLPLMKKPLMRGEEAREAIEPSK